MRETRRSSALVLKSTPVFETSSRLVLYTREHGLTTALAKGARRLKGPFHSSLDLLSYCDIVWIHKPSGALDLLTEASQIERFEAFRRQLSALYAGYYLAELLLELAASEIAHPKLFDATIVTLRQLGDPALRLQRVIRYELALLREFGLMP